MNMFARFDENPAMTLWVIKETKRYGRTDGRTHTRADNVKTVYPLQAKFAGGIIIYLWKVYIMAIWVLSSGKNIHNQIKYYLLFWHLEYSILTIVFDR